jgi:hypothetical protein
MSSDGINRTNQFDKVVMDASQGETIGENYERLKAALHLAAASAPPAATNDSSLPASEWEFSKEVHWAESTGRRPVILRAHTAEDLQALENQVLYGRQQ